MSLDRGLSGPVGPERRRNEQPSEEGVVNNGTRTIWEYESIDSKELGRRWNLPESWIRDQVRTRARDPIPHLAMGRYIRFLWGSPDLEAWLRRRIVAGNNRRVGRVQ